MLSIGQVLAERYRIDGLLGQGGMGAVYVAVDLNLSLRVAVKENQDTSPGAQKQFYLEASLLGRLSHPNLPRVTDYFFIPGQGQYLVMDYIEGEDLEQMLARQGKLPESWVLIWIEQVCEALAYLHQQIPPIIHRDIKPANIKITSSGWAMLVDFGIAKMYDPQLATTMGAKAVTPGYSPPEQYGGSSTDARTDVYALGATLYAVLTGQVLPESVQRMSSGVPIVPPRKLNSEISPAVEAAILRALEIPADKRFQTTAELRTALRQPARTVRLPAVAIVPRKRVVVGGVLFIMAFLLAGGFLAAQLANVASMPSPSTPPLRTTVKLITPTPTAQETLTPTPALALTPTPLPVITPPDRPAAVPAAGLEGLIAYEAGPDGNWQIYLTDPATQDVWLLPNQPRNSGVSSWLPDGRLAFRSRADGSWQIYTMNIDGSDLRQLTFGNGNNYEPIEFCISNAKVNLSKVNPKHRYRPIVNLVKCVVCAWWSTALL